MKKISHKYVILAFILVIIILISFFLFKNVNKVINIDSKDSVSTVLPIVKVDKKQEDVQKSNQIKLDVNEEQIDSTTHVYDSENVTNIEEAVIINERIPLDACDETVELKNPHFPYLEQCKLIKYSNYIEYDYDNRGFLFKKDNKIRGSLYNYDHVGYTEWGSSENYAVYSLVDVFPKYNKLLIAKNIYVPDVYDKYYTLIDVSKGAVIYSCCEDYMTSKYRDEIAMSCRDQCLDGENYGKHNYRDFYIYNLKGEVASISQSNNKTYKIQINRWLYGKDENRKALEIDINYDKAKKYYEHWSYGMYKAQENLSYISEYSSYIKNNKNLDLSQKTLDVISEIKSDKKEMMNIIKRWPHTFCDSPEKFRSDKEFVLEATKYILGGIEYPSHMYDDIPNIKSHSGTFCVSDEFKNSKELALQFIKNNPKNIYKYLSEKLRNDKDVTKLAIELFSENAEYMSQDLKNDLNFIKYFIEKDIDIYKYASADVRRNEELFLKSIKIDINNLNTAPVNFLTKELAIKLIVGDENLINKDQRDGNFWRASLVYKKLGAGILKKDIDIINSVADNCSASYQFYDNECTSIFHSEKEFQTVEYVKRLIDRDPEICRYYMYLSKVLSPDEQKEVVSYTLDKNPEVARNLAK